MGMPIDAVSLQGSMSTETPPVRLLAVMLILHVLIICQLYLGFAMTTSSTLSTPSSFADKCQSTVGDQTPLPVTAMIPGFIILGEKDPLKTNETQGIAKSSNIYQELPGTPRTCPSEIPNNITSDLSERSLCPWYNVLNINHNRIPSTLVEAKCLCPRCVLPPNMNLHFHSSCEPLYYATPVLLYVGTCPDGRKLYQQSKERHPVACLCGRTREAGS